MKDIDQLKLAKRFLVNRLLTDHTTFWGHSEEYDQIKELIARTAKYGESNSALITGPRGCGKTTVSSKQHSLGDKTQINILQLITSTLSELLAIETFRANTMIVNLNGFIHTDDGLALKSITKQLQLETAVNGKVFTTFADNLAFLLDCLKSGDKTKSKSVIFILEEFDLFCGHLNQTLIYNLFDVAQSAQAPICVIGTTRRYDVIELLEKRVKSRFSHRQIFLFTKDGSQSKELKTRFVDMLKLRYDFVSMVHGVMARPMV